MSKVLTYDNPPDLCLIRRTVLMPGPLPKYPIQLTPEQERHLQQLSSSYTAPFAEVQRARILLLAHQHPTWRNAEIARQVGCCVQTVKRWRQRWHADRLPARCPAGGHPPHLHAAPAGPDYPRWPVVRHAPTANPGHAGRGRNSPRSPSSSRSWSTSRQGRFVPGCARTRSNPGAITRGSTRLIPTLWTRPAPVLDLYEHAPALAAQGRSGGVQ